MKHAYHTDIDYYEGRAHGLLASARDGTSGALAVLERWDAPLTDDGARLAVAREHGCEDWEAMRRLVAALPASQEPFFLAYRAIEAHDLDGLRTQLDRAPDLVTAKGTNDNDLLGMAGAAGDERLVRLLLDRGADPAMANAHGWTGVHQAAYSDQPHLARLLLDAGAPVDRSARGDGGTPLVVALFWGNGEVAELLAERSLAPGNLRVAAGLGRLDAIEALVAPGGRLAPAAGAHRAYYRPHGGFPDWTPTDEPQEVLDEAVAWAARNDRADALDLLVARGARLEADVYRGTALAWAAATGRVAAIERLIGLGAEPSGRTTFGGPTHGQGLTPLHLAAQGGHRDAVRALLAAGADRTARDALYDSTPAGWAEHAGDPETAALLR